MISGADDQYSPNTPALSNGSGAAAILAAGIACFALAVLAFAGDRSAYVKNHLVMYKPTGALSGVSTIAIFVWLIAWAFLEWRWRTKTVALRYVVPASLILLILSLMLTFPPFADAL